MYFSPKIAVFVATLLASVNAAPAIEANAEANAVANALDTRANTPAGDVTGCSVETVCNPWTAGGSWNACCAVHLNCWAIAPGTKTRGVLDIHNAPDYHTDYLTYPADVWSDWKCKDWDYHPDSRIETVKE